jgi:hypothetical protein
MSETPISDRLHLGMNITDATGLSQGQRQTLLALGAVDEPATPASGFVTPAG